MSDINTMSEVTEITDPQLRNIADRVLNEVTLEIYKVVAHYAEPENFPLPQDPNLVEQILQKRFAGLKPEQKQLAVEKVLPIIKESSAQREIRFGDLHQVDLHSPTSVAQQVRALPIPPALQIQLKTLQNIDEIQAIFLDDGSSGTVPPYTIHRLGFRIHKVKAVDETGIDINPFGDEPGSDEIVLAATTVDESGDTKKVPEFEVGSFDDGDVKTYSPPMRFISFDLREGTEFPKSYFVTLVLTEVDQGGLSDFLNDLLNKVKEKVKEYLAEIVGGVIGASGGLVGAAIGIAVGYVVGKIFDELKDIWGDEIFPPKTVSIKMGPPPYNFGGSTHGPEAVATFAGYHGIYEVTYDWEIFAGEQEPRWLEAVLHMMRS